MWMGVVWYSMARSTPAVDDPRTELDPDDPGTVTDVLTGRLYAPDTALSGSPNGAGLTIAHPDDDEREPLITLFAPSGEHDAGGVTRTVTARVTAGDGPQAVEVSLPAAVWSALNRAHYGSGLEDATGDVAEHLGL